MTIANDKINMKKIFITGTDTNIGKTYVAKKLLRDFAQSGFSTIGIKLIASGGREDAIILRDASTLKIAYEQHNPILFEQAIAPHIAAQLANVDLSLAALNKINLDFNVDIHVIEGAGGWLLPLNQNETLADFVVQNKFEIILVVGMRLGCLNHALLTIQSIEQMGGKLIGWIANCIDPDMEYLDENIAWLKQHLKVPLLFTEAFKAC